MKTMIDPWENDQFCWVASLDHEDQMDMNEADGQSIMDPTELHEFIKKEQKLIAASSRKVSAQIPTKATHCYWLYATDNKRNHPKPTKRSGKWLVFCKPNEIDSIWAKVKKSVRAGRLGKTAKCSTKMGFKGSDYVICVYTHDWQDEDSVQTIRQELREIGVTKPIPYKTDADTLAGKYAEKGHTGISKYYE